MPIDQRTLLEQFIGVLQDRFGLDIRGDRGGGHRKAEDAPDRGSDVLDIHEFSHTGYSTEWASLASPVNPHARGAVYQAPLHYLPTAQSGPSALAFTLCRRVDHATAPQRRQCSRFLRFSAASPSFALRRPGICASRFDSDRGSVRKSIANKGGSMDLANTEA